MTKLEKIIEQFWSRPSSLKFIQIEKILLHLGFEKVEAKGSHKKFKHNQSEKDLIIPTHNNECKDFYKRQASKIAKKIKK